MFYLYTDGGSRGNPGKSAIGFFLFNESTLEDLGGVYLGTATNNNAEYTALHKGLLLAKKHGIKSLICKLDSELVVKQLNGEYQVKDENIKTLYSKIMQEKANFESLIFTHVPRAENKFADKMVNIILDANESS